MRTILTEAAGTIGRDHRSVTDVGLDTEDHLVIVAGHLIVDPQQRESYLAGCVSIVEQARRAPDCLDFALGPDLMDAGRINILERWESREAVEAFRGSGTGGEQGAEVLSASVSEYDTVNERSLS